MYVHGANFAKREKKRRGSCSIRNELLRRELVAESVKGKQRKGEYDALPRPHWAGQEDYVMVSAPHMMVKDGKKSRWRTSLA